MFDKKSDYSLNKRDKNSIVYISATGIICLTRSDFASEDEFLKWKSLSDEDYQTNERAGRGFYDNTIPLDEKLDVIGAVLSIEDELFGRIDERERRQIYYSLLKQIKSCLTEKQYRRLWMRHAEKMTVTAIAAAEGVTEQSISESILAARKNIFNFLQKHPVEMPIFL